MNKKSIARLTAIENHEKFGMLTVFKTAISYKKKCQVLVVCDCGVEFNVQWASLRSGNTKSCGCIRNNVLKQALETKESFGKVKILKEVPSNKRGKRVLCRCDCGKEWITRFDSIISGATKSCGCSSRVLRRGIPLIRKSLRMNQRYGKLLILEELNTSSRERRKVLTQCDCGNTHKVLVGSLIDGKTKSCGCYAELRPEREVYDYIVDLVGIEHVNRNDKTILQRLELDIFIPKYKLAIEFNGLIWHSEKFKKDRYFHLSKTQECKKQGIFLFHIWEDDWKFKQDQVKNKIKALLRLNQKRIFARNTKIELLETKDKNEFYNKNHIQGKCSSSINIGLRYKEITIGLMSFIKKGRGCYELIRFATSIRIVGGFSKILKYFQKHYEWKKIISFADLALSDGNLYEKTGWVLDKILPPDYKYVIRGRRYHKFGFRHKSLRTKLKNYDPSKTEYQNMTDHNFYRIYDCGKLRYVITK